MTYQNEIKEDKPKRIHNARGYVVYESGKQLEVSEALRNAQTQISTLQREKAILEIKTGYCERNHAFCPGCRDKLPPNKCFRCQCQKENEALRKTLENVIKMPSTKMLYKGQIVYQVAVPEAYMKRLNKVLTPKPLPSQNLEKDKKR